MSLKETLLENIIDKVHLDNDLQSLGSNDVIEKNIIDNVHLGSTNAPHTDGNLHSDTPKSLDITDGKVKLSCTKCTFTTATLKRSKAKQNGITY